MTPSLTADKDYPSEGDDVILTCTTPTTEVTSYEFLYGVTSLAVSANNTFTIRSAMNGTHDGTYMCTAAIYSIKSNTSNDFVLHCKLFLLICTHILKLQSIFFAYACMIMIIAYCDFYA